MSEETVSEPLAAWEGRRFLEELSERKPFIAALLSETPLAFTYPVAVYERVRGMRDDMAGLSEDSPYLAARYIGLYEERKGAGMTKP